MQSDAACCNQAAMQLAAERVWQEERRKQGMRMIEDSEAAGGRVMEGRWKLQVGQRRMLALNATQQLGSWAASNDSRRHTTIG